MRAWEFQAQLAGKDVRESLSGVQSDYSAMLVAGRATWDLNPRWDVGVLASSTTGGGSRDQGAALELGYRVIDNLWLSGGCHRRALRGRGAVQRGCLLDRGVPAHPLQVRRDHLPARQPAGEPLASRCRRHECTRQ